MTISTLSSSATVAVACALLFFVLTRLWQALSGSAGARRLFPECIMREAAQQFRDRLDRLSRKQSSYVGAAIVFVVIFTVANPLGVDTLFAGYPVWQLQLLLTILTVTACLAAYRVFRTAIEWRRVRLQRDASIAVGHQLQRLAAAHGRVYHDVATTAGLIDHVLIGPGGIFSINVIALRAPRKGEAVLADNQVHFHPGDRQASIVDIAARNNRLRKDFAMHVGHPVRIRSVIAVPGWDIPDQLAASHLLVNERTLPMLIGWRDQDDYLMNEDLDVLYDKLTVRGKCNISLRAAAA